MLRCYASVGELWVQLVNHGPTFEFEIRQTCRALVIWESDLFAESYESKS